jgi:glycosyltransferase involved in cell wall biosynthesis
LKVLFIARATLYDNKGGDTTQMLNTAAGLRNLGIQVDIRLTNEDIDYTPYDLLHFFNIIRPADILRHVGRSGKPYVVSTIFVDYSEFDKLARRGASRFVFRLFSQDGIEYIKVIARALLSKERIMSPGYLFKGQKRSIRRVIRGAALLLPNSASEYDRLYRRYRVEQRYRVIPNAVDPAIFTPPFPAAPREEDLVLCVGRVEGLKNQLSLINALKGSRYRLLIIGSPANNQPGYYELCKQEAGPAVTFLEGIPQTSLVAYYARARVHVLPSWFETTGLSTLEAAAMGCRVVITRKGDQTEYFGDHAFYCDPAAPETILSAVDKAMQAPPDDSLQQKILTSYTWRQAAEKTAAAYAEIQTFSLKN